MVDSIQGLAPMAHVTMGADSEPLSLSIMTLLMKRIQVIGSQQNGPEYLTKRSTSSPREKSRHRRNVPLAMLQGVSARGRSKARFRAVLTM